MYSVSLRGSYKGDIELQCLENLLTTVLDWPSHLSN